MWSATLHWVKLIWVQHKNIVRKPSFQNIFFSKVSKWNVTAGFKCGSCIYKEGQDVKSLYIWVCCLVSPTVGSSQALPSHTWFRPGHFQPPFTSHTLSDTHTHIHTLFFFLSFWVSSLFACVSLSLSLPFSFLFLFGVQLESPSSLHQTTSFDTHSKGLSVNSHTDRMRPCLPKKLCRVCEKYLKLLCMNTLHYCMLLRA